MFSVSPVFAPVRLPVDFPTARALLADYARSLGGGGVSVPTARQVAVGARFLFELRAPGMERPVEAPAVVRWSRPAPASAGAVRLLGVEYLEPAAADPGIEEALRLVAREQRAELIRRHVRLPAWIPVRGPLGEFRIRDLSQQGFGLQVEDGRPLAGRIERGLRVHLELRGEDASVPLAGRVAWVAGTGAVPAATAFGIDLLHAGPEVRALISRLARLRGLPRYVVLY